VRSNNHFGRHILISLHNAWTYLNESSHNYSLTGVLDDDDVPDMTYNVFGGTLSLNQSINQSSSLWVLRSRLQTTFSENALFCRVMMVDGLTSEAV